MGLGDIQQRAIDVIGRQESLDQLSVAVQEALNRAFDEAGAPGQQIENALHGTPLGHPAHPALVTIPIGAWTVTQVLDGIEAFTGNEAFAPGADAALTVGLFGALASALTGMTDWKDTDEQARRIGFVHGLLNLSATALYIGSLAARRRNQRQAGRQRALVGYALVMLSGIIGGDLVYRRRIGTNHANSVDLSQDFVAVLDDAALAEGQVRRVEVEGEPVVLARKGGRVYALAEHCSHLGGPLSEGKLEMDSIQCPWHGSRFALEDGRVLDGPATFTQPCFAVRVRQGKIELSAAAPASLAAQESAPPTERERQLGANDYQV